MNHSTPDTRTKLTRYRNKRDFARTAEPSGDRKSATSGHRYVIQKHAARRLHYDFRLELGGVLKSWAVTRGPSLNPEDKRLAVHVEDHPLDYGSFEGTIPHGQYGGGTVMLWDEGSWQPLGDPERDYARGSLTFLLEGKRLHGRWHLVRLRGARSGDTKRENWLLIKGKDQYATTDGDAALEKYQTSVMSRRSMAGIAKASGDGEHSGGAQRKPAVAAQPAKLPKKSGAAKPASPAGRSGSGAVRSQATFVAPQLATLVSSPPRGKGWVHEIKFDGYRLLAVLNHARARLFTRAGNDWSERFTRLCRALEKLKVNDAVLDGEIVIADEAGSSSFHALQDALSRGKLGHLRFYAFDLLHLNGMDLRSKPLTERKAPLEQLLRGAPPILGYSQHFDEPGDRMLAHACELALEGIISKQADAPYRSGRSSAWLKSKCIKEQEFVIGGYTQQPKHPGMLGALLIGYYEKDALQFAGKVGTGFSATEGAALLKKLHTLDAKASPFAGLPAAARRGARFVAPQLVAHINFGEWTPDGKLRHPSFQGLREDKPAREVMREKVKSLSTVVPPAARKSPRRSLKVKTAESSTVVGITITHPDRILWPESEITKLELARYYAAIAPKLLADAGNRPISLVRCPQGPGRQCFFQRHAGDGMPEHVHAVNVSGRGEGKPFIFIDDVEGLVSLVQMGTIELHAWNAPASAVKQPDRVIFDLDPGPDVPWKEIKTAAQDMRSALQELRLQALLKTTGGKGLHVVVPIASGPSWAQVKQFARSVCESLARIEPQRFTINNRKDVRAGRIFLDYLRNDETASAVAAYSVRARPGAPVSLPIEWTELAQLQSGDAFHLEDALKRREDPWAHVAKLSRQALPGS